MDELIITDRRKVMQIVIAVIASVFIFSIDYSMLNISLPIIAKYFHVTIAAVSLLPMVYILVVTSTLLGFGRLGDMRGYKRVFILGLAIFGVGTILCSIAPTMRWLLIFRMVQSSGEAMLSPMGIAILTTYLAPNMRGRALGLVALAQGLGFAVGNIFGGLINTHFMWRAIFLVNLPIIIFTVILSIKALPEKHFKPDGNKFDFLGALIIFITLASLIYGLNSLETIKNGIGAGVIISFAVAAIGFVLFIIREKSISYPLLDLGLFKNRDFAYSNLAAFMVITGLMGTIFLAPFYLELVKELPVMKAGAFLMIAPIMMLLLAPISGRLSDRIGSRLLCSIGALFQIAAFGVFSMLGQGASSVLVALALFTIGIAAGIFMAPNNKLVLLHAPVDKQGVASGVYKTGLSVGSVIGIAIFPIVIMHTVMKRIAAEHISMEQARHSPEILAAGFHSAFVLAIFISIAAFIFSVLARDKKE